MAMRIRRSGPNGVVRPFIPQIGTAKEDEQADTLESIAVSLAAIDHNLEALTKAVQLIAEMQAHATRGR